MALEDGDPRAAAHDLVRLLSPWEKRLAERAFGRRLALGRRLASAGLFDPQYPHNEPAHRVAGEAVRSGVGRGALRSAQVSWGVFWTLGLATEIWPGLRGPVMLGAFIAASAVTALGAAVVGWRRRQVRRYLAGQESESITPPTLVPPVAPGSLGPYELAPVLMERVTGLEAAVVRDSFLGSGLGKPLWDGSPRDRLLLRRWLFVAAGVVLFLVVLGALILDFVISWAVQGFQDAIEPSGAFAVAWAVGLVWFVRRSLQIRAWYRAGLGHEAAFARLAQTTDDPVAAATEARRRSSERMHDVEAALLGVLGLGMAAVLIPAALHSRADVQPIAGGITTDGTVVHVDPIAGRFADRSATVTFTDPRGRTFTITKKIGGAQPAVGDHVRVTYDPDRPQEGRDIDTNAGIWKAQLGAGLAGGVMGVFFLGITVNRFRAGQRRRRG